MYTTVNNYGCLYTPHKPDIFQDMTKQELKGGAEEDWVGSGRKYYCYLTKPGVGKSIKQGMAQRRRQEDKRIVYDELSETHNGKSSG